MTVIKRKRPVKEEQPAVQESGVQYTCDVCGADLSHTIRLRCAQRYPSPSMEPVCPDFDLCGSCFCEGKEVALHKAWHDYRVVENHAFPIFTEDWGADEELLLIDACQKFGLGNWQDVAEHVGTRTKAEVEQHYLDVYIRGGGSEFVPNGNKEFEIDPDTFRARKKARLEELQSKQHTMPPPKPLPSGPTCHEISGVMPGRLEFDVEWENEAEQLIKDLDFGMVWRWGGIDQPEKLPDPSKQKDTHSSSVDSGFGEGGLPNGVDYHASPTINGISSSHPALNPATAPVQSSKRLAPTSYDTGHDGEDEGGNEDDDRSLRQGTICKSPSTQAEEPPETVEMVPEEEDMDLELKLLILEIFNDQYDRRLEVKEFIFDRGLLEYKKHAAADKKRSKEERDIVNRHRVFARLQTAEDHEEFVNGLLYEAQLRKRIAQLQEYRRNGVTSFAEVEHYEKHKAERGGKAGPNWDRFGARGVRGPGEEEGNKDGIKRYVPTLTGLSNAPSLSLLSDTEQFLCSRLRILPKPYLFIKETIIQQWALRIEARTDPDKDEEDTIVEPMTREEAMGMFEDLDKEKVGVIWDFLEDEGLVGNLEELYEGADDEEDQDQDPDEQGEFYIQGNGDGTIFAELEDGTGDVRSGDVEINGLLSSSLDPVPLSENSASSRVEDGQSQQTTIAS